MARMIRAGYNVLSVHADAHFSDDPYVYIKGPHLNKATLLTMSHGGWTGLTSGFIYVQEAAVSGPVSWIFTETVDRVSAHICTLLPLCIAYNAPPRARHLLEEPDMAPLFVSVESFALIRFQV